jgi:hypothetical protein
MTYFVRIHVTVIFFLIVAESFELFNVVADFALIALFRCVISNQKTTGISRD